MVHDLCNINDVCHNLLHIRQLLACVQQVFSIVKDLLKYTKNKTDQIEQLDATIELIGERFHDEMMSMVKKNSDLSSQIAESASLLQGNPYLLSSPKLISRILKNII